MHTLLSAAPADFAWPRSGAVDVRVLFLSSGDMTEYGERILLLCATPLWWEFAFKTQAVLNTA